MYKSYYFEWPIEQIRDVGLSIINQERNLLKQGKTLQNANPYNVTGNALSDENITKGSSLTYQFVYDLYAYYILILQMFKGNPKIARSVMCCNKDMSLQGDLDYLLGMNNSNEGEYIKYVNLIEIKTRKEELRNILNVLDELEQTIRDIQIEQSGVWSNYQDLMCDNDYRLNIVLEKIKEKNECNSVLELGANQGLLSRMIEKRIKNIKNIICTDYDEGAINKLFKMLKTSDGTSIISPRIYDITKSNIPSIMIETNENRLRSDIVIALALSHHLILSQNVSMERLFDILNQLTNKYLIIEFMPLGLWDGIHDTPDFPEWYSLDNFKKIMELYFKVEYVEKIAENRILLIGEK